ncbi:MULTISPECIES: mechanosensitive ion channel domain-containing protein [Nitrincola]|uniref:Small-conductance mechanosensitive channel n=1 Tax=Nitrincola nitratireducens TaxID=1229521 RepID=W9V4N1_9GAMM|nr:MULTISPECIES: mechanosensitive ion channel domain-containing protein [Nitrincola]EXJ11087.1 Small-conductance mechanosensitive channel [Nitrincola nitratireducens]
MYINIWLRRCFLFFALILATFSSVNAETQESQSYEALAALLENDALRAQLIQDLRTLASPHEDAAAIDTSSDNVSLARQIANQTQFIAEELISQIISGVGALNSLTDEGSSVDWSTITLSVLNLGYVILATLLTFFILRRLLTPLFRMADGWTTQSHAFAPLLMRLFAVIFAAIADLFAVGVAWVAGYGVALLLVGELGGMDSTQSLFLNAFLLIEAFKAIVRMVFSSRFDGLRLLPMCAETSAYWNTWIARLSGFIGYGMLLLVPVINFHLTPVLGRFVSLLIMLVAFSYAFVIIMQNKARVSTQIRARAEEADFAFTTVLLNMLARSWHVISIAYFAGLLLVTVIRPDDALPIMLQASLQTLIAVGAGLFISALLTQIISRQIRIPEETKLRFPALEARLNGFIPTSLKIIRLVIMLIVMALVLDAWGLFNLNLWLASTGGTRFVSMLLSVALILIVSKLLWIAFASWVEHRLNPNTGSGEPSAREKTLLTLFRNAVMISLTVLTAMITLAELGINIGPLIAGAGVIGLAIGFGAQTLVKDVITGVFIQLENAINTGDVVTADGITGTAENLTIRSLGLRDRFGTYHLIPFSSITSVSNYMRGFGYHVGEYGVAYREDTDEVVVRLREAFDELMTDPEMQAVIMGELEVQGITEFGDNAVNIRVRIKTLPGSQWGVGRAYNRLVKRHFDAAGVEIPFPHLTVYFGQNKDGSAPPAPINIVKMPSTQQRSLNSDIDADRARTNTDARGDYEEPDN